MENEVLSKERKKENLQMSQCVFYASTKATLADSKVWER